MAKQVAKLIVGENASILVETTEEETLPAEDGMGPAGIKDGLKALKAYIVKETKEKFADAMTIISFSANTMLKEIEQIRTKPDEAQIEFGVKVNGEGKTMIASGGAEANYKVTLSWKNPE